MAIKTVECVKCAKKDLDYYDVGAWLCEEHGEQLEKIVDDYLYPEKDKQ